MEFILLGGLLLLFIGMNYFSRKKQNQAAAQRAEAIVIGNSVRTHSGFYGTIVDIDGLTVTLESPGGTETVWHKNAIFGIEEPPFAADDALEGELEAIEGFSSETDAPVSTLDHPIEKEQDK